MQVEYESSPPPLPLATGAGTGPEDNSMVQEDEGFSFRPGPGGGDESDDGEEEETVEAGKKPKAKKPIKQRQSLAEKQPGTTLFPMSRVKRIVKADKELENMSNEAVFMVAVATEYFIKHFMEEGYTKARLEKRKIVNYKDLAAVVSRSEEFDFLKDVIPTPISLSEALERRKQKFSADENPSFPDEDGTAQQAMDDGDLPPLAPSTNPLFPNAIMKKPPNTHAKTAVARSAAGGDDEEELPESSAVPVPVPAPAPARSPVADKAVPTHTPRVLSGKSAPTTPHGLTTRGAARRSLAGTDVDMSPVIDTRRAREEAIAAGAGGDEAEGEAVVDADGDGDGDERMD